MLERLASITHPQIGTTTPDSLMGVGQRGRLADTGGGRTDWAGVCCASTMRGSYSWAADLAAVVARLVDLHARTVIFDVEPLVAFWDTDEATLRHGVATVLDRMTGAPEVTVVGFATNSQRRLTLSPTSDRVRVLYVAGARKPASVRPYRELPRPGAVVGDQVATDGVLARRLRYAFIHYLPALDRIPFGPNLMNQLGRPLLPLLFGRPD